MIQVSVVISTLDRFEQVQEAVASVRPQLRPGDECIVVDNGFPPERHAALRRRLAAADVRLEREPTPGISPARNHGARLARGEMLAFLDDDAVAADEWVEQIRAAGAAGRYDALGGPVRLPPSLERPAWFPPAYRWVFGELDFGGERFDMTWRQLPMGANVAFRRSAFVAAGGFPTTFGRTGADFAGGEEIVLCREILRRGGRIGYLPRMVVTHRVPPSRLTFTHMARSAYGMGRSDGRIELSLGGRAAFVARGGLRAARLIAEAPLAAWRHWRGDPRAWVEHRIRAAIVRGHFGLGAPLGAPE